MQGLTEKVAAILKEANQDAVIRQQLFKEPIAFLKARGLNVFDLSDLELSYADEYGVFLGIHARSLSGIPHELGEQRDKDINSDHFMDCLSY